MKSLEIQIEARQWIEKECPPALKNLKTFTPYREAPDPSQIDYILAKFYDSKITRNKESQTVASDSPTKV